MARICNVMKVMVVTAGLTAYACGGSEPLIVAPEAAPLPALNVVGTRVFTGDEGLKINVVDLAGGEALVQITGIQNELSEKVLKCETKDDGRYFRYMTKLHGRPLGVLVRRTSNGRGYWRTYMPSIMRDGRTVAYSDELSPTLDVDAMQRTHAAQVATGELDALQRFDRTAEQEQENASLTELVSHTSAECKQEISVEVDWSTVSDEQILEYSVSSYCGSLLSGMRSVCRWEAGRQFVRTQLKTAVCRFRGEAELAFEGQQAIWQVGFETVNLDQRAKDALLASNLAAEQRTLQAAVLDEQTMVCVKDDHAIVVGPREASHGGMAYGSRQELFRISAPQMLGEGWFFDPRQRDDTRNSNFRGYDMRIHHYVKPDKQADACKVVCGQRETTFSMLHGKKKQQFLKAAQYQASLDTRRPYALARDTRGTYYYVDRGTTEASKKDFRLYRGQRGSVSALKMRDVVSDSEGEVFASSSGHLRLVVGKQSAQWISKGYTKRLTLLPVSENLTMIYNELGVYLGKRLGVPCDDY